MRVIRRGSSESSVGRCLGAVVIERKQYFYIISCTTHSVGMCDVWFICPKPRRFIAKVGGCLIAGGCMR
jgi:hypothetical protein